jgi:hypothetical protein
MEGAMTERLRALVVLSILALATKAEAFPAFARKTGMSCTACHVAWPILNQQGQSFRDNGYQLGLEKDDPVTISSAYVPFAVRSTAGYEYVRTTNQTSDAGPVAISGGGVPAPGMDLLTGGVIAKDLSYLVVVAGFLADEPAGIESAWARVSNLGGTGWLNVKAGKFELDLPASSHRPATLTAGYAAYGAHPSGSAVGFDMGENQVGVEIDGHNARSTTRYGVSLVSASDDPGSAGAWSSPLVYGHLQQAFDLDNSVLPWVRLGVLGAVGWWPTQFASDGGNPIPGTGRQHKKYSRVGGELTGILGYPSTPFMVTAAYIYGREDAGLASGTDPASGIDLSTQANSFSGAFVEVDWVPVAAVAYNATPWLVFARYDAVRYQTGAGDVDGFTVGVRRYLAFGPRASMALHAEFHTDKTKGVGWADPLGSGAGLDVANQTVLVGLDFAF